MTKSNYDIVELFNEIEDESSLTHDVEEFLTEYTQSVASPVLDHEEDVSPLHDEYLEQQSESVDELREQLTNAVEAIEVAKQQLKSKSMLSATDYDKLTCLHVGLESHLPDRSRYTNPSDFRELKVATENAMSDKQAALVLAGVIAGGAIFIKFVSWLIGKYQKSKGGKLAVFKKKGYSLSEMLDSNPKGTHSIKEKIEENIKKADSDPFDLELVAKLNKENDELKKVEKLLTETIAEIRSVHIPAMKACIEAVNSLIRNSTEIKDKEVIEKIKKFDDASRTEKVVSFFGGDRKVEAKNGDVKVNPIELLDTANGLTDIITRLKDDELIQEVKAIRNSMANLVRDMETMKASKNHISWSRVRAADKYFKYLKRIDANIRKIFMILAKIIDENGKMISTVEIAAKEVLRATKVAKEGNKK